MATTGAVAKGGGNSDFPKIPLESALRVPKAIIDKNAGQPMAPTDLALAIGISPGSSVLRDLTAGSARYGLTEGTAWASSITTKPPAQQILEPTSDEERRNALATAALNPPVFRLIFDSLRGKKLPSDSTFFQNTIVRDFKVPKEQAAKCIQVFTANMRLLGYVKEGPTGQWLSDSTPATATGTSPRRAPPTAEPSVGGFAEPEEILVESPAFAPVEPTKSKVKNAIFLGHGPNRKPLEQLKAVLEKYGIDYRLAVDEPNAGRPISQKVADLMQECGAGIFIFTADEEFRDKDGNTIWKPADNAIYELGAASVLYGKRIIIFKEKSVHFPTNFRDIGYIEFERDSLTARVNELFGELIAFGLIRVSVAA